MPEKNPKEDHGRLYADVEGELIQLESGSKGMDPEMFSVEAELRKKGIDFTERTNIRLVRIKDK